MMHHLSKDRQTRKFEADCVTHTTCNEDQHVEYTDALEVRVVDSSIIYQQSISDIREGLRFGCRRYVFGSCDLRNISLRLD